MPNAPLRYCVVNGCPNKVPRGRCITHQLPAWQSPNREPTKRIRGRELQRRRQRLFAEHPFCVLCERDGKLTLATIRDHIIPLAEGGSDDESNVQALCSLHNELKRREEARRGRGLSSTGGRV